MRSDIVYKEIRNTFTYLLHPLPALLITSISKNQKPNVMTISWIIPVSINPPLIAVSLRPERYTYALIKETKNFAINIPDYSLRKSVFICGRFSGRNTDKFKKANLTPIPAHKITAPLIKECTAHIECSLEDIVELKADHHIVIGKVIYSEALEEYFETIYDPSKYKALLYFGKDVYTTTGEYETIKLSEEN